MPEMPPIPEITSEVRSQLCCPKINTLYGEEKEKRD